MKSSLAKLLCAAVLLLGAVGGTHGARTGGGRALARTDFVGSDPVGSDTVGSDPIGSDTAGNGVQKEQASSSRGPTPGPSPITPVTEPDRPAPPSRSPPSASPAVALGPSTECVTAYDYLSANGTFTEFLQIVEAAGLADLLKDPSQVAMLFVPTPSAFASIFTGVDLTVSSLIKDKELLSAIVDFHVAPNYALRPAQLTNNLQIPTLATDQLITVFVPLGSPVAFGGAQGYAIASTLETLTLCDVVAYVLDSVLISSAADAILVSQGKVAASG
uniref:FAS1 domain-containing protein n=1 Tax=Auxenochlorella protothecoides TaxID=3075 RepID=A0A1D2AGZ5_AUXPR